MPKKPTTPAKAAQGVTINQLADETGADRRSIKKWLALEQVKPVGRSKLGQHESDLFPPLPAHEAIAKHQSKATQSQTVDPETGLTWFQAKVREDTIRERRENEIAEGLKDEQLMETATVEKLILLFIGRLDLVPVKIQSEFALDEKVIKRLTELLDEARGEMAKGVLKI